MYFIQLKIKVMIMNEELIFYKQIIRSFKENRKLQLLEKNLYKKTFNMDRNITIDIMNLSVNGINSVNIIKIVHTLRLNHLLSNGEIFGRTFTIKQMLEFLNRAK